QLALDKNIYYSVNEKTYLGAIKHADSSTNVTYLDTNYVKSLLSKKTSYGLPNFVTSYFNKPTIDFSYRTTCSTDSIYFNGKISGSMISPNWYIFKNSVLIHSITGATSSF